MHDYVCFIAPTDFCVVLCTRLFVKIALNFILKWFQPNSFGEVCFLGKSYKNLQRIQILKILRAPLFDIREYAFKFEGLGLIKS